MNREEIDQIAVFDALEAKRIKQAKAAALLNLSSRQVKRKLVEYRLMGVASLIHKARGKPSNNQISQGLKDQAIQLVRDKYPDFGPTLAAEKLAELDKLTINREVLRQAMTSAGLWQPKAKKVKAVHVWRERRDHTGELVQIDGSPHAWFEDRASKCTLLAFIDDATSRILWLEFAQSESTESLMQATWHYLKACGRPLSIYSDRGGVYKVNNHNPDQELVTQYHRALDELNIELIHARSPQAKGRVERLFETLQDRLVKELRLAGISSIAKANRFLWGVYVAKHNAKFAVVPKQQLDLHRCLEGVELTTTLCLKNERVVTADLTVRYRNSWLQLAVSQKTIIRPRDTIEVYEYLDGELSLWSRKTQLSYTVIPKPASQRYIPQLQKLKLRHKPAADHPWRSKPNKNQKGDISTLQKSDILTLV